MAADWRGAGAWLRLAIERKSVELIGSLAGVGFEAGKETGILEFIFAADQFGKGHQAHSFDLFEGFFQFFCRPPDPWRGVYGPAT